MPIISSSADILSESFRAKPRTSERCAAINTFIFNWSSLSQSLQEKQVPLSKATLRAYMKVIPRLFKRNSIPVSMDVYMTSSGLNNTSARVHAGHNEMIVTPQSASWVELDISTGVRSLWPPRENENRVEITVIFRTNCDVSKKVPIIFEDPTSIPVQQKKRRQRMYGFQPIFLVSLSDEEVKEIIKSESVRLENSTKYGNVGSLIDSADSAGERERRSSVSQPCHRDDYFINFSNLGMTQIYWPVTYNAYQCHGSCSHNTINLNNEVANNHAKLLASAKVISAEPNSPVAEPVVPCCVGDTYYGLTLVVPKGEHSLQYAFYTEMVIDECKCR